MTETSYKSPGVAIWNEFPLPAAGLRTGVPVFLGYAAKGPEDARHRPEPCMLMLWSEFGDKFGPPLSTSVLADAVRGFFENDGGMCFVLHLDAQMPPDEALKAGLATLEPLQTIDLICMPDIAWRYRQRAITEEAARQMQMTLLEHCATTGDRFAILDALHGVSLSSVEQHAQQLRQGHAREASGALYYPWITVANELVKTGKPIPPCGHIAGVYARSDRQNGVHKAPANEVLHGVLDLEYLLSDAEQARLNPIGINCLRAFPGRGIRVWGARTLSRDPAWIYVNVRRLFLAVRRWIEEHMAAVVFEPHDPGLWARINRELTAYCNTLLHQGALKGRSAQEAFYIKCDAEINPPEVRDAGKVVTEIGLAAAAPSEFIVVRIVQSGSGVTITGTTLGI